MHAKSKFAIAMMTEPNQGRGRVRFAFSFPGILSFLASFLQVTLLDLSYIWYSVVRQVWLVRSDGRMDGWMQSRSVRSFVARFHIE